MACIFIIIHQDKLDLKLLHLFLYRSGTAGGRHNWWRLFYLSPNSKWALPVRTFEHRDAVDRTKNKQTMLTFITRWRIYPFSFLVCPIFLCVCACGILNFRLSRPGSQAKLYTALSSIHVLLFTLRMLFVLICSLEQWYWWIAFTQSSYLSTKDCVSFMSSVTPEWQPTLWNNVQGKTYL